MSKRDSQQDKPAGSQAIEKFRSMFEFINQDTLAKASLASPELVKDIVIDNRLTPLVRAHALLALAHTHNEEYFKLIESFITHESPLLREAAYMGLFEYYDFENGNHLELVDLFQQIAVREQSPGVRKKVSDLLEHMR